MATDAKRLAAEAMLSTLALPEGEAGWARDARAKARTRLLEAGAPIRRDEYWKYTDPSRLTVPLAPAEAVADMPAETGTGGDVFSGLRGPRLRFVNGRLRADLSDDAAQENLAARPLSEILRQDVGIARTLFGVLEEAGQEKVARPLASLNTAAAEEGIVLQATGPVARPVELRYDQIGDGASLVHHLVRAEIGAKLTLLETGTAGNTSMEVDLAPGAEVHHIRLQEGERQPSATHLFARIAEGAAFKSFTLTADGQLTRNEIVMDLVGEGASGHVAGAVLGSGDAHTDNTIFVTHTGTEGESRQVFKNVLAGEAKGIFQGKIFVRPGAQKTDGYQISQSVLLNPGAEFSAKPELEIYADDVKCSHGSTTGALDRTALFYLRSRGIPESEAISMLVLSFVAEAIEEIDDEEIAGVVRAEVAAWMGRRP